MGLRHLLEPFGRLRVVRIGVRMVLLGEPAVGLLDLGLARGVGDPEDLIEVFCRHVSLHPVRSRPALAPDEPAVP
jgi:hypothetical protein